MPDRSLFDPPLHQDTDPFDAHAPPRPAPFDPEHIHYMIIAPEARLVLEDGIPRDDVLPIALKDVDHLARHWEGHRSPSTGQVGRVEVRYVSPWQRADADPILLNGLRLEPNARVTVRRTIDRGSGAWVNGIRLHPGDRLHRAGELLHAEPPADFRDATLPEHEEDGA